MRETRLVTAAAQPCLLSFNRANPQAIKWAEKRSATLIKGVTAETRAAVREIIKSAIEDGMTPRDAAQLIRDVPIGLTKQQAQAVVNLKKNIVDATARADALGRPVTVTYSDRLVRVPARVVIDTDTGKRTVVNHITKSTKLKVPPGGLSSSRILELQKQYAERLRKQRALTIARTEAITAANQGQLESWSQNRAAGLLRGTEKKRWSTTPDDRACPDCAALDGVEVKMDDQFNGGSYGMVDGPALHPRCRCAVVLAV